MIAVRASREWRRAVWRARWERSAALRKAGWQLVVKVAIVTALAVFAFKLGWLK